MLYSCCMEARGCGKGLYSGTIPYCYMEDMRCIATMRKEPLEVYLWGEVSAQRLCISRTLSLPLSFALVFATSLSCTFCGTELRV